MGKGPGEQGNKKKKKGEGTVEHKQEGFSLLFSPMRMQSGPRFLSSAGSLWVSIRVRARQKIVSYCGEQPTSVSKLADIVNSLAAFTDA